MVRFAMMVLMALRDLRFLSIVFFAHLTRPIAFFPLSNSFLFYSDSVFKNREVSDQASRHANMDCSLCHGECERIVPRCQYFDCVRVARGESIPATCASVLGTGAACANREVCRFDSFGSYGCSRIVLLLQCD